MFFYILSTQNKLFSYGKKSPHAFLLNLVLLLTFDIERKQYYCFERTKMKIKYFEIFLVEKKKSQSIQFLQHNFSWCSILFLFFLNRPLRIGL